jgi:hypothetical protein
MYAIARLLSCGRPMIFFDNITHWHFQVGQSYVGQSYDGSGK